MISWFTFMAFFGTLLVFDAVMTRQNEVTVKRSLAMTGFYMVVSTLFCIYLHFSMGATASSQFYVIYWLEQLLSVDNLLVMSLIFAFFSIPNRLQHTALWFGIIGAIVFRTANILMGTSMIAEFPWIIYLFAGFLMFTGYKIIFGGEDDPMAPESKKFIVWLKNKFGPSGAFLAAIISVEICDIMFAVDSIPASFSITNDSYVILTANLCAVLGLRSLYHAVQHGLTLLEGLQGYIGAVLVVVGADAVISHLWMQIPAPVTMFVTFAILGVGIVITLHKKGYRND